MNYAESREYIQRNPLKIVKALKEPKKTELIWTKDEVMRFLTANEDDPILPFFIAALNTGLRRGELSALTWDKVDFNLKRITVSGTRDRYGQRELTKSGNDRIVPMNDKVTELLHELKRNSASQWIFVGKSGDPIDAHHIYRNFEKMRIRAKIQRKIRFHDLRHTYATHFITNGGEMALLGRVLGHADFKTTQRYLHLTPSYLDKASDIVSF